MAAASAVAWAVRRSLRSSPPSRLRARTPKMATRETTTRTREIPRRRAPEVGERKSMGGSPRATRGRSVTHQLRGPGDELLGPERPQPLPVVDDLDGHVVARPVVRIPGRVDRHQAG